MADVAGTLRSGVVVESTRASMSAGSTPDMASAALPDSIESSAVDPPTWRALMPVRSTIQASLVSSVRSRSAFVTVSRPSAHPNP
ncbi:MAG: hypothetical protein WKF58_00495 [Ilumatobacteraceae bacterium]